MVIDIGTHLDLFDLLRLLRFPRGIGLFLGLIFELADIEKLGDGRIGVGRNLNQVESNLGCLINRFAGVHHAQIFAIFVNHTHLGRRDKLVKPGAVHRRGAGAHGSPGG